jgi:hypothetical protein
MASLNLPNKRARYSKYERRTRSQKIVDFFTLRATALAGTGAGKTFTATAEAKATGTLTSTGAIQDGGTVTVDGEVWTFKTALTSPPVEREVLIGANQAASHTNLQAAMNGAAGNGSLYSSNTTPSTKVDAASGGSGITTLTAKNPGTAGNSIATTETCNNTSFGASTLAGGVDAVFTATAHGYSVGDGPFVPSNSGGALPGGLSASRLYWIAAVPSADTFKLTAKRGGNGAVSPATSAGTGTHTLTKSSTAAAIYATLRKRNFRTVRAATDVDTL